MEHLLWWLVFLTSLPAAYLGFVWLFGWFGHLVPSLDPVIQNHPFLKDVMVLAFFDAGAVCTLGLGAQIVATVFWLFLLVVGKSTARKASGLACLVLAGFGIHAAKAICLH